VSEQVLIDVVRTEVLTETFPELLVTTEERLEALTDMATSEVLVDSQTETVVDTTEVLTILRECGEQGPPGPAGQPGEASVQFPAGEAIGGHRAVRLIAGRVYYADNTELTGANVLLGVSKGAAVEDALVTIQTLGLMTEPSWAWAPDQPVFVGVNGLLTQAVPVAGFSLMVGFATSPTQIFIGLKMPIILE